MGMIVWIVKGRCMWLEDGYEVVFLVLKGCWGNLVGNVGLKGVYD
jgi:hypothetical protein